MKKKTLTKITKEGLPQRIYEGLRLALRKDRRSKDRMQAEPRLGTEIKLITRGWPSIRNKYDLESTRGRTLLREWPTSKLIYILRKRGKSTVEKPRGGIKGKPPQLRLLGGDGQPSNRGPRKREKNQRRSQRKSSWCRSASQVLTKRHQTKQKQPGDNTSFRQNAHSRVLTTVKG